MNNEEIKLLMELLEQEIELLREEGAPDDEIEKRAVIQHKLFAMQVA